MKKHFYFFLFAFVTIASQSFGQSIVGTVRDTTGILAGATVRITGTGGVGTTTNTTGQYKLTVKPGRYTVNVSYVGYISTNKEVTLAADQTVTLDFVLAPASLGEVVVVGSRSAPRSRLDSPVPVDVVDIKKLTRDVSQVSLNQILNYAAPSFNSNTQTLADGTDHIDPASLRGLGPDQVLVLINGKRRHTTSLVNINGSFGKGSVGTDLNAIPTAAISRVEILRDGAAAQYGSDAIAGVINIVLNTDTNKITGNITTGGYASGKSRDGLDGQGVQANVNYGLPIGDQGGFVNVTGSYDYRNYTDRSGIFNGTIFSDYNDPSLATVPGTPTGKDITDAELAKRGLTRADFGSRVGQSANRGGSLFFNSSIPLKKDAEIYAFGGLNFRKGEAAAFFRTPSQLTQTNATIYPNGFLPLILTDNQDQSLAVGIRGTISNWKIDFSNVYGQNTVDFNVGNTFNASLLTASPTSFEAGGYLFKQNTTNLDLTRKFDKVLSGLNLAFGAEHRYEKYGITAGEESSYVNYGKSINVGTADNPILVPDPKGTIDTRFAANGAALAGGAQSFPGFSPDNAVKASRTAVAAYTDAELNITQKLLIEGALRFENYSDFGSTLNWKLSTRYKFSDAFLLRGAASTGFRAPSLHQRYFSATSTIFSSGQFIESGTFTNDSRVAKLLGIPKLKEETSRNYSLGFTSNLGAFKLTVDGYLIDIDNRIVYTGQFAKVTTNPTAQDLEINALLDQANAGSARFFANAIDTRTKGVDAVLSYTTNVGPGRLRADLAGTFAQTNLRGKIKSSPQLAGRETAYFDDASRIYLQSAVPQNKVNLSLTYGIGKWSFFARSVYFGKVKEATNVVTAQDWYDAKIVTDLSASYEIIKGLRFTAGANNLFDIYPEAVSAANSSSGRFIYSRSAQQFGFNGRYVFTRLGFNF